MNKKVAEKWVKALRSGKYKQGIMNLKKDDQFCCLGVLCEITNINGDFETNSEIGYSHLKTILKTPLGSIYNNDEYESSLSSLNDSGPPGYNKGLNFNEIADIIQMTWKEL